MNIQFELANESDAKELTVISIDAFHSDFDVAGRRAEGGPPGYDSVVFHEQMIKESTRFYKIVEEDSIIGGFWFDREGPKKTNFGRIFLDPKFHHTGVGLQAFEFLFQNFPSIESWSLKVPVWNTRTPMFYCKLGFEITDKSDRFFFFTKRIGLNVKK